jgi:glyoxylase I family protein
MSGPPKLTLHHVNLVSDDVERANAFYRDVMGLAPPLSGLPTLDKTRGYGGDVVFLSDGRIQHHLAQKDVIAGFRAGQTVNPVSHGHIAYRTEDMAAFLAHLDALGIPYSDWGDQAVKGWRQVFFYDPDGNVIEVHQVDRNAET